MQNGKTISIKVRGIIIDDGKLLAVKHPHNLNYCALPGGHLEWKEDIRQCLEREITEELGVKPEVGKLLYINNFIDKDTTQIIELFYEIKNGDDYKNTADLEKTHAHEIAEVCWIAPTEASTLRPHKLAEDFSNGKIPTNEVTYIFN